MKTVFRWQICCVLSLAALGCFLVGHFFPSVQAVHAARSENVAHLAGLIKTPLRGGLDPVLNLKDSAAIVSAANYVGTALAPEQIAAAFGANLAPVTQKARTNPLPTTLAGTQVRVVDRMGLPRLAPLFFVSPGQINFQIPIGTAIGNARVEITNENGASSSGIITVEPTAPGLFSFDATGQGFAAAQVLRVRADGSQQYENIARVSNGEWEALPIDLSNTSEQYYLILYGTGWRGRSSGSIVIATIGGTNVEVLYASQQGALAGLDQANLRLPRTLIGRGTLEAALTVNGRTTNVVKLNIK